MSLNISANDNSPVSLQRVQALYGDVLPLLTMQRERLMAEIVRNPLVLLDTTAEFWENEQTTLTEFFAGRLFREVTNYYEQSLAILEEMAAAAADDGVSTVKEWQHVIMRMWQDAAQRRGWAALKDFEIGIDWDLVNRDAVEWARDYAAQLVSGVNDATKADIARHVANFLDIKGYNLGQLRGNVLQELQSFYGAGYDTRRLQIRAKNIAITETTRALAEGNKIVWQRSGVADGRTWVTNNDDIVCDTCRDLDRQSTTLTAPFTSKSGAIVTDIPAHPGCRCFSVPIVRMIPAKPVGRPAPDEDKPKKTRKPRESDPLKKVKPAKTAREARERIKDKSLTDSEYNQYLSALRAAQDVQMEVVLNVQTEFETLNHKSAMGEKISKRALAAAEAKLDKEMRKWTEYTNRITAAEQDYIVRILASPSKSTPWNLARSEQSTNRAALDTTDLSGVSPSMRARIERSIDMINQVMNWDAYEQLLQDAGYWTPTFVVDPQNTRAFANPERGRVTIGTSARERTMCHEMGHIIEYVLSDVGDAARNFRTVRAGAEPLSTIYSGTKEVGWRDQFIEHYMGRYYGVRSPHTEIISMGIEYMLFDAEEFAKKDPEYFYLIWDVMKGNISELKKWKTIAEKGY